MQIQGGVLIHEIVFAKFNSAIDLLKLIRVCEGNDTDSDGIDDYLDLDSDNDGISDLEESGVRCSLLWTLIATVLSMAAQFIDLNRKWTSRCARVNLWK